MMSFVLIGKSVRIALPVFQAINGFSDQKCVLVGDEESRVLRMSKFCKEHLLISFDGHGDDHFVRVINGIEENNAEVILIPFDCEGIKLVNRTRTLLKHKIIPIPDEKMIDLFEDKWSFYEFCSNNFLTVPYTRFIGLKSNLNFSAIVSEMGLPFVLKPTNWSGSMGVQIVRSKKQFEEDIQNNPQYEYGSLIAQRYVDGVDIGLDLFAVHGKVCAIAMQQPVKSAMRFISNDYLKEAAEKICGASSYHGVMNVDARVENGTGKVFLIESNPRFWASLITSVDCGLNFLDEVVHHTSPIASMRELTSGISYIRHPLIRPSSWWSLISDRGQQGRLLRARMFDLFCVGQLIADLPRMAKDFMTQRSAFILKLLKVQNKQNHLEVDEKVPSVGSVSTKSVESKGFI